MQCRRRAALPRRRYYRRAALPEAWRRAFPGAGQFAQLRLPPLQSALPRVSCFLLWGMIRDNENPIRPPSNGEFNLPLVELQAVKALNRRKAYIRNTTASDQFAVFAAQHPVADRHRRWRER